MPLTPQQQQNFWSFLAGRGVQVIHCRVCSVVHTSDQPAMTLGGMIEAPDSTAPGTTVRMVQLVCNRCSSVLLFSIDPPVLHAGP